MPQLLDWTGKSIKRTIIFNEQRLGILILFMIGNTNLSFHQRAQYVY